MATQHNTKSLAWQDYRTSKKRNTSKGKVINALIDNNNEPLNNRSLVEVTGLEMGNITRAVHDLTKEGVLLQVVKPSIQTGNKVKYSYLKSCNAFKNQQYNGQ